MDEKSLSKEIVKILEDYLRSLKARLKGLPASEKEEIIKEIRADIIMELKEKKKDDESEIEFLLSTLKKIGEPEEIAEEIISRRVLSFKGNFVKRFLIFTGNSLTYALLGLFSSFLSFSFYCFGFILFAMAIVKIFFPANAGLFISEKGLGGIGIFFDSSAIGIDIMEPRGKDVLGLWNIPFGIISGFLLVTAGNFLTLKLGKIGKKLLGV